MWFIVGLIAFAAITGLLFKHKSRPTWIGLAWAAGGTGAEYCVNRPKGKAVELLFGVTAPAKLQFTLRQEKWYDRVAKLLTLSAEYQVGDDAFDRAFYILSDNEVVCRVLLGDARLREDLLGLISTRLGKFQVTHLHASGGKLWLRMESSFQLVLDEDAHHAMNAVVSSLRSVEKRIGVLLKARPIDRDRSFVMAAMFAAVSLGFAVHGAAATLVYVFAGISGAIVLDHQQLLTHAALLAASVIGVLALGSRVLLGRSSRGHLVLTELLSFGLLGAFATAWIELRALNMEFDRATPLAVSTLAVSKDVTKGSKGGMSYTIGLRDWTGEDATRTFGVSSNVYHQVQAGQLVRLDEHPGLLGYRWIDNIQP